MYPIFSNKAETYKSPLALRLKLFSMGYEPIPILAAEKKPLITGWTTGDITHDRIVELSRAHPDHLSTGFRTGHHVGVDIDLHDPTDAEVVQVLTEDFLGVTPLHRVGSKGFMLGYHNPGPTVGKLAVRGRHASWAADIKDKTLVEIFGRGNQYVAFGIHPDTHLPYRWIKPDGEPLVIPLAQLPVVDAARLHELHGLLQGWLTHLGYVVRGVEKEYVTHTAPGRREDAADVTDLFLHLVPGGRRSRSGFINFRCPSCSCQDGRAGIVVTSDGGFRFSCFHTGCGYFAPTGWSPGGGLGARTRDLYVLMGGDLDDLPVYRPQVNYVGYSCVDEMIRDREAIKRVALR